MPPPVYSVRWGAVFNQVGTEGTFVLEPVPAGKTGVLRWITITNKAGAASTIDVALNAPPFGAPVLGVWTLPAWPASGASISEEFRVVLEAGDFLQGGVTGGPCDIVLSGYLLSGVSPI